MNKFKVFRKSYALFNDCFTSPENPSRTIRSFVCLGMGKESRYLGPDAELLGSSCKGPK